MKKLIGTMALFCFLLVGISAQGVQSENQNIDHLFTLIAQMDEVADDHCEVPCGIYGDSLRIALMYEHVSTIEKGMSKIVEMSEADEPNYNQIVRWVVNKEHHSEEIQNLVSQYWLHQRVKMPKDRISADGAKDYRNKLAILHSISVYAMKSKQTTDSGYAKKMRDAIHEFEHAYFGDGHDHSKK